MKKYLFSILAVLGGWMLNAIYTYQTGQPLIWKNGSTATPGDFI